MLRITCLTILVALSSPFTYAQNFRNSVGGRYAAQADASVARDKTETSLVNNPAGLAKIKVSSISSGASSYSLLRVEDESHSYTSLSSASNHVAMVFSGENFNYGFMIFNSSTLKQEEFDYSERKNSEDYQTFQDSQTIQDGSVLNYSFSFAPKNENYGFSFNLLNYDFRNQVNTSAYNYSQVNPNNRSNYNTNTAVLLKILTASIDFGYQGRITKDISWGVKASSPTYILQNNSKIYLNMLYVTPNGANDNYIFNIRQDSDYTTNDSMFTRGMLNLGLAFEKNQFELEMDFRINPAYKSISLNQKKTPYQASWNSSTNTNTIQDSFDQSNFNENTKATIDLSMGGHYQIDSKTSYGMGVAYVPTTAQDNSGVNSLTISAGLTKNYKNFTGSYAFLYNKGIDAGNNKAINPNDNDEYEKISISYEQFSFIFGGSYHF